MSVARAHDKRWNELEDGDALHALHVRQLADAALAASAELAVGIGAARRFVVPSGSAQVKNRVDLDEQALVVELENIALVTASGQLARMAPPAKSIHVPEGERSFLNLYTRAFASGSGETEPRWEPELAGPSGISIAEWHRDTKTLEIVPLPFSLPAQVSVEEGHARLVQACAALSAALQVAPPDALARLALSPDQRALLEPLLQSLDDLGCIPVDAPIAAALIAWRRLANVASSWSCYVAARIDRRDVSPDPWSRRELMRRTPASDLPRDVVLLRGREPATATELVRWLDGVTSVVKHLLAVIEGASEELRLKPFETVVPEGWPLGVRYGFALPPRSSSAAVRCEIDAPRPPNVYSAQSASSQNAKLTLRQLRGGALLESGLRRFELLLAAAPGPDTLVLVIDPGPAALRAYLRAAHIAPHSIDAVRS